ncbi:MAG: DUF2752 domain-containing protein [Sphingobacteriia bacterium]
MPADYFDSGQSICVSRALFNVECYACGLTRATMHLLHLDFSAAWAYNWLTFIVTPFLGIVWLKYLLESLGVRILSWL